MKQGFEPPTFSCHFLGWNPNLWAQDSSYETYRKQVTQGVTSGKEELKKYDEGRKFPYEQLKGKSCPQGVDPTMKEVVRPSSSSHMCPFCIASYSAGFIVFVCGESLVEHGGRVWSVSNTQQIIRLYKLVSGYSAPCTAEVYYQAVLS